MKASTEDKLPVRCSKDCGYGGYRNQSTWKRRPCPRCGEPVKLKTRTVPVAELPPALPPIEYRQRSGCSGWWVSYFEYGTGSTRRRQQESLTAMRDDPLTLEAWAKERARGARLIVVGEHTWPALRRILTGEAGDLDRAITSAVNAEKGDQ